jgi:O-antigen/teichoic acid export membrane protein
MIALNAILCFILIPSYGYSGAAVSSTIPAVVDFWLYSALCHRYAGLSLPWGTGLRIAVGTVTMSIAGYLALRLGANVLIVALLVTPSLYLACLVVLNVIGAEERRFINEIIPIKGLRHDPISPAGD